MNVHELPLVTFTILAQMSVGAFVVLGLIQLAGRKRYGAERMDKLSDPALYAIGPVMVLGLIASIFHLGNPMNAANSILGIGHSWLSREIFFGVAFAGGGALFALAQWKKLFSASLRQLIAVVTAVIGIGLVFSMSMVYMLPTVPAWNSPATPIGFFTTALLLGALSVGAALLFVVIRRGDSGSDMDIVRAAVRQLSVLAILLVGVSFVVLPTFTLGLVADGGAAAVSASAMMSAGGGWVFGLRLVLLFVGAGLIGLYMFKSAATGKEGALARAAYLAIVMVLVAEVLGRVLFYASFHNVGL